MSTNNRRRTTQPTAVSQLQAVERKFEELERIRTRIAELKALYAQHDALVGELLSLFITKTDTQFIINREIVLGTKRKKLIPFFYDEKKGTILTKRWKSVAHETFTIE